ncbi:type II toxin-antitoxin system TacA family antitoxin [Mycobacterium haemophilum]
MAVKTKRIELRAEQATLDRIQRAANVVHEQISEFVRKAAMQRAEDVLQQQLLTVMEPEQFDKLMSSLDIADAAPRLAAAARKPVVFTRR